MQTKKATAPEINLQINTILTKQLFNASYGTFIVKQSSGLKLMQSSVLKTNQLCQLTRLIEFAVLPEEVSMHGDFQ